MYHDFQLRNDDQGSVGMQLCVDFGKLAGRVLARGRDRSLLEGWGEGLTVVDLEAWVGWIVAEGGVLRELAAVHPNVAVPSCPGWDMQALMGHVGSAHRWVVDIVDSAGDRSRHERVLAEPPRPLDEALAWFDESVGLLVEALWACDADAPTWTPVPPDGLSDRDWWARKQAIEATVHRHDGAAACALGSSSEPEPEPIEARLAVSGIEEHLHGFAPMLASVVADDLPDVVLHLEAIDGPTGTGSSWWLDLRPSDGEPSSAVTDEPGSPDLEWTTTLTGSASDLLLWLWNRHLDPTALVTSGDPTIATAWRAVSI